VQRGEVTCLMCGTVVGDVKQGRFTHHTGCERPVHWRSRLPRCCRCGGSLYFDPAMFVQRYAGTDEVRVGGSRGN
jgi:hypothetical protein